MKAKYIRILLSLSVIVLLISSSSLPAYCIYKDLITEELSQEQQMEYINSIELKKIETEIYNLNVCCIAVSEDGLVAVGLWNRLARYDTKYINFYDTDGNFKYAFSLKTVKQPYFDWDGDNLSVIDESKGLIYSIDRSGTCLEARGVPSNNSNDNYINWLSYRTVETKYGTFIKGDPDGFILDKNSDISRKAYRVTTDNKKIIIYDADKDEVHKESSRFNLMPVRILLLVCFVAIIIVVIILIRKLKK